MIKNIFTLLSFLLFFNSGYAQKKSNKATIKKCYTVEVLNEKKKNNPNLISTDAFENWLNPLIKRRKQSRLAVVNYTLPVVFHVIHNNEMLGSGRNLTKAAIEAQLLQMNKDFANLSGSPYAVAINSGIQFALATKDPNGNNLTEPGINRISTSSKGWTNAPYTYTYVETTIKPNSIWDPNKYINIWVTDLSGEGILGFASFPGSSTLNGLDNSETNTDAGVVIDYSTIGSIFTSNDCGVTNEYGMGKSLTHEMGHFFGLRHIWGDQDPAPCSDDFCGDTPLHFDANFGKPSHPKSNSCGTQDEMFENYMDYSDDIILNTFTADQVDRMQTVLLNSPRRVSLPTSNVGFSMPASANKIAFALCTGLLQVTETGNAGTTSRYKDIPLVINVQNVATGNATVNFTVGGTAINNIDYQLSATSVNFIAGDASKTINLRILDNAKQDALRTIVLSYTITGSG
ncbi:MAG: M43 family zinc metalloprotease, partial [Chitinophagaceae bacterium]